MARYILVAMNGPTPDGDPETLERWYREVHMPDLLSVDGIVSARRFETVKGAVPHNALWPNVALYEIETDDLAKVSAGLQTNLRPYPPEFDRSRSGHIWAIETARREE